MDINQKIEQLKVDKWAEYQSLINATRNSLESLSDEELDTQIDEMEDRLNYLSSSLNTYRFNYGDESNNEEMRNAMFQYGLTQDILEILNNKKSERISTNNNIQPLDIGQR